MNSSLAAIQLRFALQNYNITEGGVVNITLEASGFLDSYEFGFTVTLQSMNGSATGESITVRDWSNFTAAFHSVVLQSPPPPDSWQWLHTWSIHCELQCWSNVCHLDGAYLGWQHNRAIRVLQGGDWLHWPTKCCWDWFTQHDNCHHWGQWSR